VAGQLVVFQGFAEGVAVLFKHHRVGDDEVGNEVDRFFDALLAVVGHFQAVGRIEYRQQVLHHVGVVFHDHQQRLLAGSYGRDRRGATGLGRRRRFQGYSLAVLLPRDGQGDGKHTAFAHFALYADVAAHQLDQLPGKRQADASALPCRRLPGGTAGCGISGEADLKIAVKDMGKFIGRNADAGILHNLFSETHGFSGPAGEKT